MDTSKIIIGTVGGGRYTVTAPIVKEDYGLYLKIEGLELPSTYEVDFSNSEHNGTSVTMIGNADGVLIPSQFISSGKDVFAFLYHVGEDYGRTIFKFRIPNKLRPDRTNEQPTPEEQSTIDQAISALNSAVEQTAQDVIDADQSAQDSASSALSASDSAERASASATSASNSASSASASATASAQSASQAEQIKTDVQGMVSDAQGYAQSASASAQSASGYASQAQTSAQTASAKAQDASTSAQTASNKASEASQSASSALTYKTDAESAKTASQTAQGLAESARDSAVSAKNDAEQIKTDVQNIADGIDTRLTDIEDALAEKAPVITDTASGSIASFSDGADGLPLKSLVVDINPVQDTSSGDPSPTNICPISGWTSVDVEQRGVNVWDEEWEVGAIVNATGQNTAADNRIRSKNYIPCLPNTAYYCNGNFANGLFFYDANKQYLSGRYPLNTVITTPNNARYIRFCCAIAYGTTYNHDISINYPSTDHSYHPYTGRSITIDLGQTVYGGKLDVLSGKLTVYPEYDSYNGETLTGRWISDRDVYAVGTTPTIGAQVVNIGAEGTEIQLEPHEVASLLGTNNIFADTGDVSCEYRADTRLYIEKLTQPEEDDMVADSAITSGQFFMIGNSLYRALANIASGATITVGTNAQRVSLADALNLINT